MDERDYKAMNDELKSAEEIYIKVSHRERGRYLIGSPPLVALAMREYADQFKKQLKEKEKKIQKCKDLANVQYKKWVERNEKLQERLTKSNEMNERLAGQIGLFLNFGGKEHLEEALEQYQNSKK